MSWLSSFLHPGEGYDKAQEQLNRYYHDANSRVQPYSQHGIDQYSNLNEMISKLMNPGALRDEWIKNYSESGAAKNAESIARESGLNAAESMHLLGSSPALNAIQSGTAQIGLNDRDNYLKNMIQNYLSAAGLSQGIYGQGQNAASEMGRNDMNMGGNSADMAYGRQTAGGNMMSGLIGGGVGLLGTALGGPVGGLASSSAWGLTGGKH